MVLAVAYHFCQSNLVRPLCQMGANPNHPNSYVRTPLMYAAERNDFEMTRDLLAFGADRDLRDKAGSTAFAIAEALGQVEVKRALNSGA